jgi:hypothetical protein
MAHPKRRKAAEDLYIKLTHQPFSFVGVTWDQKDDEWDTGKRALLANYKSDWHIVIQDDAILPANFYRHVVDAITHVPELTLISLYTGRVRPFRSRVQDAVNKASRASWLRGNTLYWGVGIAIPTKHIKPMLEFVTGLATPYDARIGRFYQANMMPVYYTNPSLVDHNDDMGSLIGNNYAKDPRVAHNFIKGPVVWNKKHIVI